MGQTAITGGAEGVAIYGNYAYVGEPGAIDIVDVSESRESEGRRDFRLGTLIGGSSVKLVDNNDYRSLVLGKFRHIRLRRKC